MVLLQIVRNDITFFDSMQRDSSSSVGCFNLFSDCNISKGCFSDNSFSFWSASIGLHLFSTILTCYACSLRLFFAFISVHDSLWNCVSITYLIHIGALIWLLLTDLCCKLLPNWGDVLHKLQNVHLLNPFSNPSQKIDNVLCYLHLELKKQQEIPVRTVRQTADFVTPYSYLHYFSIKQMTVELQSYLPKEYFSRQKAYKGNPNTMKIPTARHLVQ